MIERLTHLRNECLFNSFVMFSSVRRVKDENKNSNRKSYWINFGVVLFTLLSVLLSTFDTTQCTVFSKWSLIFSLLAFGASISIFLFRNNYDTKIDFNIANSYWLLHKRIQDLIYLCNQKSCITNINDIDLYICQEVEKVIYQMELLVRLSPVFKKDDICAAIKEISSDSAFLYLDDAELNAIRNYFEKRGKSCGA